MFGHWDVKRHNQGDTKSIFTSWSTSKDTAIIHAGKKYGELILFNFYSLINYIRGVLLQAKVPLYKVFASHDEWAEHEVLVAGPVKANVELLGNNSIVSLLFLCKLISNKLQLQQIHKPKFRFS